MNTNKILLFLAEGFEEVEATTPIVYCRHMDLPLQTVSVTGCKTVVGAHGVPVVADVLFEEADFDGVEMLVLPGGLPGAYNLAEHKGLAEKLMEFSKDNKMIAALCAAPLVLGKLGILKGKKAVCYPGFEEYLEGADIFEMDAVRDGNIITGNGPGGAMHFGHLIVEHFLGTEKANEMTEGMMAYWF